MSHVRVLHVVPRFHHGGPAGGILAQQRHAKRLDLGIHVEVLALERGGSQDLVRQAMRQRLRVHIAPPADRERDLIRDCDVLVLDWWNTPAMWAFIDRWRGQELRWILECEVNGLHRPQRLPASLAQAPCHLVLTSPHCTDLRTDGCVSVIPAIADAPERLPSQPAPGNLVHVGTVNVFKLDPAVVDVHTTAAACGARITVLGSGGDEERFAERAVELSVSGIEFPGFSHDPDVAVRGATAFTAPTAPFGYGSCDKTVQSALLQGLPVLTYRDSPIAHMVQADVTGWLAADRGHFRELAVQIAAGDLRLPVDQVAAVAARQHSPDARIRSLNGVVLQVAAGLPRPVDDGFESLDRWLAEQVGVDGVLDDEIVESLEAARRPPLVDLIHDPALLHRHGRWGCEGGLAQFTRELGPALAQL